MLLLIFLLGGLMPLSFGQAVGTEHDNQAENRFSAFQDPGPSFGKFGNFGKGGGGPPFPGPGTRPWPLLNDGRNPKRPQNPPGWGGNFPEAGSNSWGGGNQGFGRPPNSQNLENQQPGGFTWGFEPPQPSFNQVAGNNWENNNQGNFNEENQRPVWNGQGSSNPWGNPVGNQPGNQVGWGNRPQGNRPQPIIESSEERPVWGSEGSTSLNMGGNRPLRPPTTRRTTTRETTSTTQRTTTTPQSTFDGTTDEIFSTTTTTMSPCQRACPVTPEFNPVCTQEGNTFFNPGRLKCAQSCGKREVLSHYGTCSTARATRRLTTSTEPNLISPGRLNW